jgi:hypothetical protein
MYFSVTVIANSHNFVYDLYRCRIQYLCTQIWNMYINGDTYLGFVNIIIRANTYAILEHYGLISPSLPYKNDNELF